MTLSPNAYAGDVAPDVAFAGLLDNPQARLVDVRTEPEWTFVGIAETGSAAAPAIMQAWQIWPHMGINGDFVANLSAQLEQSGTGREAPLYFLCRSGARSLSAAKAMTQAGFRHCYNIAGGFEGDMDANRHRGLVNGWKASGLPWRQG